MNRPQISDFFPESTTPKDLNKVFLANPELYRYIQALDGYIDELEEKLDEVRPKLDEEQPGICRIKTSHGDILVKRSKFLKQDEMAVIDLSKKPDQ
jgi:hypothetical protein